MNLQLKSGLTFQRRGKVVTVGKIRNSHEKIELNSDDGDMVVMSPADLRREFSEGECQLLVEDKSGTYRVISSDWRDRQTEHAREILIERNKILGYVDEERRKGKNHKEIIAELPRYCHTLQHIKRPPCERTLRDWRKRRGAHESMLSPAWSNCGNRHQGPDDLLLQAMREVTNAAILGSDIFTISAAWCLVEARYSELWKSSMGDAAQPPHSRKQLKNFLKAFPWDELMKLRLDGRTARAITRVAVYTHTAEVFWDCVEMDATVLDINICDEQNRELGRPLLYAAIDVATGYIIGLYLTTQSPSAFGFVECLRFMCFPKPAGFDEKYKIQNRIEVYGKPIVLKVDNGSEFVGKVAEEVVAQLFGDSARCAPYRPDQKPHVERFNNTLRAFILTLPGATTSSINGEYRTRRKGEKLLTLEELRGQLFRFVYDKYSLLVNELRSRKFKKALAPFDIWKEMSATFTQPIPINRADFENALMYKRDSRKLGHDGIYFDGWLYHSNDLAAMYLKFGPGKYSILYSDLDATTISVIPPDGASAVFAFEKTLDQIAIDRHAAKKIREQLRFEGKELNRRTIEFAQQQLRRLDKAAKSSRSRAKQAGYDEKLNAATEILRATQPLDRAANRISRESTAEISSAATATVRGRKMGEKK